MQHEAGQDTLAAIQAAVAAAIATERQRTARVLLHVAERRRLECGVDPIVLAVALIANEITAPDQ